MKTTHTGSSNPAIWRIVLFISVVLWCMLGTANAQFLPVSLDQDCTEVVAHYAVDPQIASAVVPPAFTLKLGNFIPGTADLLLATQECRNILVKIGDRVLSTGPAGVSHVWISINAPDPNEIACDPLPETSCNPLDGKPLTLPTMYWYSVRVQTDNLVVANAFRLGGADVELIQQVTLGADGNVRQGEVMEREYPHVTYSWEESRVAQPSFPYGLYGINHRVYRQLGQTVIPASARCLVQVYGQGTSLLKADPRSLFGDMGFSTLDTPLFAPFTWDFNAGCKADLNPE